ncbi:MAG: hypothetical protein ACN4GT_08260 [Gammaproteobacteria bacterium]
MKRIYRIHSLGLAALAAMGLLTACGGDPDPGMKRIEVTTTVVPPPGVEGPVEVRLFQLWSLEGMMRHPLQLLDIVPAEANKAFTHTIDYPANFGEGLAVFAWIDTDDDGIHCTPTVRDDMSGLATVESVDSGKAEVIVTLTDACRAPGWFYPPAE